MITVGITGGEGFIGYHLWVYLTYKQKDVNVVRLSRNLKNDLAKLKTCDVIIHTAEKNRGDETTLYNNNIESTNKLIECLQVINTQPLVIYTSSIHEDSPTIYGQWRRDNIQAFKKWAANNNFIAIKLPNIFGPFCKPNYNSFIATFCCKLLSGEKLSTTTTPINLLYVENLCHQIWEVINRVRTEITFDTTKTPEQVGELLQYYFDYYYHKGFIPQFKNAFELDLFTTFISYIPLQSRPRRIKTFADERGNLSELIVAKNQGQMFYSNTNPGHVRGNHFHTKRIERFCVVSGTAEIKMRKVGTSEVISYLIQGKDTSVIDMPPYYTHNLINRGKDNLVCVFWMNDILTEVPIDDTYFEKVDI